MWDVKHPRARGLMLYRNHPERGWQFWMAGSGMWGRSTDYSANQRSPARDGFQTVSFTSTWAEPEHESA